MKELVAQPDRSLSRGYPIARLDEPRDPEAGPGKARQVHAQDRLSRKVARLLQAGDRPRRPGRQRPPRRRVRDRPQPRQARQAGRPRRMGHDAADGQRLLQPGHERDRLPRRDPPAAVLRPERRRRRELRRHRRGHRPRDRPRLRRPGLEVRRRRQHEQLVDRPRPQGIREPGQEADRAVQRLRADPVARPERQRRAHDRREHRRPGRPDDRLQGVPALAQGARRPR